MFYKGMEEAMQGMIAMRAMQDTISNDLANANTPGFQEDELMVADFGNMYSAALNGQAVAAGYMPAGGGLDGNIHLLMKSVTKFQQGRLKATHQPFDLALQGKGFFTIQGRDGVRFTRDGSFTLNGEGYLVTADGGLVLGEHGPIKIKGNTFKVKEDGSIFVNGKKVDTLRITWVDEKDLSKVGESDFKAANPLEWPVATRTKVMQGYLEMSNVNPVKEMVEMLQVMRAYEASTNLLQTEDNMAKQANQLGQVQM
jgi:flagellar basal-body rod protein FlgF